MFEYIKRVSVATSFIAHKIDNDGHKLKTILEDISFDLLLIAQSFKLEEYKINDLKKLESKISYLIDLMDFARINLYISNMNAKVFIDSQIAFLKHILNLIDQKNSLTLPMYHLKQLDEVLIRKQAKEFAQSKFSNLSNSQNLNNSHFNFTDIPQVNQNQNLNYQNIVVPQMEINNKISNEENTPKKEPVEVAKKILEESIITPIDSIVEGSLESMEQQIEDRRAKILKALINGGGSIKEIASKLKEVNEKTIQRDLLELMRDKKVIMLGKKRWAKYYLK